jgi:hypothetical protein
LKQTAFLLGMYDVAALIVFDEHHRAVVDSIKSPTQPPPEPTGQRPSSMTRPLDSVDHLAAVSRSSDIRPATQSRIFRTGHYWIARPVQRRERALEPARRTQAFRRNLVCPFWPEMANLPVSVRNSRALLGSSLRAL